MATKRMLVDATHPEETRIVITSGSRLDEFDFESASRRQLRGNIYLAKVTRVEPSLQAAFVEYGGNRHGFLAFSEIHPDYYQIPVADREALMRDEADDEQAGEPVPETTDSAAADAQTSQTSVSDATTEDGNSDSETDSDNDGNVQEAGENDESIEDIGGDDALEEVPQRKRRQMRHYKIQEVIKRRQVMLVQVVKEERGNKGAALTSYLSLAGRYSVLMPNTVRGGGISRKITSPADRKRLKEIAGHLSVPEGMGVILRTAGASRTKAEVKRDFEYLMRLWENIRELTLKSAAPSLVYEEGSLIKRTIRDLYNKDISEVLVSGDTAYREAKDFMRMIMPSHAKNVKAYKDDQPIFARFNVESQLDSMFSPQVTLPSGGYLVINPTEALVSIDVNSGKATREHNIEDTALQTNLEAATEVARQLRLRDLAGLIVIDFIDMMEKRSIRAVERRLKDSLKNDRARIQVGRISHFGLMEMSRQRMRFGVLESSTHSCPTCQGTGLVRAVESLALMVMRAVEDHVLRRPGFSVNIRVPVDVALYILNAKRQALASLEVKCKLTITVTADAEMAGSQYVIERGESRTGMARDQAGTPVGVDSAAIAEGTGDASQDETETSENTGKRRRRRRRKPAEAGGGTDTVSETAEDTPANTEDTGKDVRKDEAAKSPGDDTSEEPRKRRRRGRRGGRRNRRTDGDVAAAGQTAAGSEIKVTQSEDAPAAANEAEAGPETTTPEPESKPAGAIAASEPDETRTKPKRPRRSRKKPVDAEPAPAQPAKESSAAPAKTEPVEVEATSGQNDDGGKAPARNPRRKKLPGEGVVVTSSSSEEKESAKPKKKAGWWQKGFFG